jgi:hypothetical protein
MQHRKTVSRRTFVHFLSQNIPMLRDVIQSSSSLSAGCKRLAALLLVLCPILWTSSLHATTISASVVAPSCGDEADCCLEFTINFTQATDEIIIDLVGSGSDDCFKWDCYEAQDNPPTDDLSNPANGKMTVTFSPPRSSGSYSFKLCGPVSCWNNWSGFSWETKLSGTSVETGLSALPRCGSIQGCGGDCSPTKIYNNGGFIDICYTNNTGASVCTLKVVITPALQDCNFEPSGPGQIPYVRYLHPGLVFSSWQHVGNPPTSTELTFTALNGSHCIDDCQQACFRLKACPDTARIIHTIKVTDPSNDTCATSPSTPFKAAQGHRGPAIVVEQNYPNPITSDNWYRTVIPFTTSAEGVAVITVTNESGAIVFSQQQEITAKGRHAFYFSGESLPSGTYFYRIESPRGVMIVEKTMLIVK